MAALLLAVSASPGVGAYHVSLALAGLAVAATEPDGASWLPLRHPWLLLCAVPLFVPVEYGLTDVPAAAPLLAWLHTGVGTLFLSPQALGLVAGTAAVAWLSRRPA